MIRAKAILKTIVFIHCFHKSSYCFELICWQKSFSMFNVSKFNFFPVDFILFFWPSFQFEGEENHVWFMSSIKMYGSAEKVNILRVSRTKRLIGTLISFVLQSKRQNLFEMIKIFSTSFIYIPNQQRSPNAVTIQITFSSINFHTQMFFHQVEWEGQKTFFYEWKRCCERLREQQMKIYVCKKGKWMEVDDAFR